MAALAHRRRRPAVTGAAGREHLQQPGPTRLDHPGPHGTAVPGVLVARHRPEPAGLHHLGRLRPGLAVLPVGLRPELQPDGVDGGAVRPGALRPAGPLRDPAGVDRSGQRRRRDLGRPDGVEGHLAAGPAGIGGPPRGDAHGSHRQLHGVPAPAVRVADDQPAAPAGLRGGRARQERADRPLRCRPSCPTCSRQRCRCRRGRVSLRPARCRRRSPGSCRRPRPTTRTRWRSSRPGTCPSSSPTSRPWTSRSARPKQVLKTPVPGSTPAAAVTTTTTTAPPVKGTKSSSKAGARARRRRAQGATTTSTAPTSTEPKGGSTTTSSTLASAAARG